MVFKKPIVVILNLLLITGCANIVPKYKYHSKKQSSQLKKQTPTQTINEFKAESQRIELDKSIESENFVKRDERFLSPVRNKDVRFWIKYYTTRNKAGLERFMANGEKYKPIIEKIFSQYGLPQDLYYVGIVESGYYNRAKSHAGAVGPWQFMKGTARRYGLKVTKSIDERKNIYKSTEAAALYFQDLYNIFGSWELALAAYNAGEYGVIRRIRGANTREYYELSKRKILPKETRNYVPKVLAVKEIIENPIKYSLNVKKVDNSFFKYTKPVKIKNSIKITTLAKKLKVSVKTLKALNHDILGAYIPYLGRKGFNVFIPNKSKITTEDINQYFASTPKSKTRTKTKKIVNYNKADFHTVRKSESLYSISKRYNIKLSTLKSYNKLRSDKIYIGQKINIPGKYKTKTLYSYTVKKGDNLSIIASIFKIKIKNIKTMNNLKKSSVFIGQKLKVPPHKTLYHTVKKGEFLGKIAKRNNKTIAFLKKINGIRNHIYPGQKLIINIQMI